MTRSYILIIALALLGMATGARAESSQPFPPGCANVKVASGTFRAWEQPKRLPDAYFLNAREQRLAVSAFRGRPLLLHFWGTWCPACLQEMPALARLQASELVGDLLILPLSRDSGGASKVTAYYLDNQITGLAVVTDRWGKLSHAVAVNKVPETLYIDRQGREVGRLTGLFNWDDPAVRRHLARCLDL